MPGENSESPKPVIPKRKRGRPPLPADVVKSKPVQFFTREEYGIWVREFAAWTRMDITRLIEEALSRYARDRKYPHPPPDR